MTQKTPYDMLDGQPVEAVTLTHGKVTARLITYGARLTHLWAPGRDGTVADIVLGFDRLEDYVANDAYIGATCGRYGNRIRDGRLVLDGAVHALDRNEGAHHLHGGSQGFDRKLWSIADLTGESVTFTALSPAGEMGFPGTASLRVTYRLTEAGLSVVMEAETDAPTVMNMVHHSYFNLAGKGTVLDHRIRLNAPFYTPVDAALQATGEVRAVAGTVFDFTLAKPIGQDIATLPPGPGGAGGGYDHNWCLADAGKTLREAAVAWDPASGRRLTLRTTEPGLQFYTGGYLSAAVTGKGGVPLCKHAGFCLESQKFPGSPGIGHFPSARLDPGMGYRHEMQFGLSICGPSGEDV